ncbi:hypothetical protein AHAS_Ahas17G0212400 [Arachis hypogaea]
MKKIFYKIPIAVVSTNVNSIHVVAPACPLVASPSFVVDLNRKDKNDCVVRENRSFHQLAIEMASSPCTMSDCVDDDGEPDRVENAMQEDVRTMSLST